MKVRDGNWYITDYWLIGESRKNFASMVLLKDNYFGPICLDLYAMVMAPCTQDINCMWDGKIGFEAYCTRVAFRNLTIRRATYEPIDPVYVPDF